jgi:hypothetical protein
VTQGSAETAEQAITDLNGNQNQIFTSVSVRCNSEFPVVLQRQQHIQFEVRSPSLLVSPGQTLQRSETPTSLVVKQPCNSRAAAMATASPWSAISRNQQAPFLMVASFAAYVRLGEYRIPAPSQYRLVFNFAKSLSLV